MSSRTSRTAPTATAAAGPRNTASDADVPPLDAFKLDVFCVAEELQVLVAGLLPKSARVLRDQLERASTSCVLNIAEGCARRSTRERAHHYNIARGSAMESAAIVRLAYRRRLVDPVLSRRALALAARVVQMLVKLEERTRRTKQA
jgi:four helix bundle protein